ncbi:TetR/AcrR family transcriptional regulator [Actinoalloteichus sp. AHMU CJ021]|uniref:Transcriptional regulator, TetR family n=1 Tax=Actinoalloteichus caeruleus DSM 43889 TaxID=1120930 RepID=A0ABT1JKL8_ACTCY|nr:TetR/AcrR family transcriptional regulator [Actinoalloteichus caeruleus]AUS78693.1 TetR/AcrR family transcriptional regulator [Actinoalloteichus sp. AHMU CJ021]MCP2332839.1 transcriptional regulator, TetR family [Actinoalloteichus caeruleus DSM 43889]
MAVGRPRGFDVDERLDRALEVFWRQGYEGTALSDLTEAMGINRPSLYSAYGNKEELFRAVVLRYAEGPGGHLRAALLAPTARAVVERLLRGTVEVVTARDHGGCLFVQAALATGEQGGRPRDELASWRRSGELELRRRLQRARDEGDLPGDLDAADLARHVMTTSHGLAVQATHGATRAELDRVVELFLSGPPWAESPA